jgi:hypothetical protein
MSPGRTLLQTDYVLVLLYKKFVEPPPSEFSSDEYVKTWLLSG